MGAPKGNQFWKLRSKHGRDKLFASPELLWEACVEYFEYTDSRKWSKKDWVGKDGFEVERETDTPYTLSGLCVYLDASRDWWNKFRDSCKESKSKDFLGVITRVEEIMHTQNFEGASVGAYNANIIARSLGLVDQKKVENSGEINLKQITGIEVK